MQWDGFAAKFRYNHDSGDSVRVDLTKTTCGPEFTHRLHAHRTLQLNAVGKARAFMRTTVGFIRWQHNDVESISGQTLADNTEIYTWSRTKCSRIFWAWTLQ